MKAARLAILFLLASGQAAADQDTGTAPQAVYVSSSRDPEWKNYRAFMAGMQVFEQQHALAPAAALRFALRPASPGLGFNGITLRILGERTNEPVKVDADGGFSLPRIEAAADEDAELALNKKKGLFRWRPDIRSPGVPADARRLGDLRLECAVRWAIEQAGIPALFRKIIGAYGACDSAMVKVDFISNRPVGAIYLVHGTRRVALADSAIEEGGHVYVPPLHDSSWPDDTLLELAARPAVLSAKVAAQ